MKKVLQACAEKAESLKKIVQAFIPVEQGDLSTRGRRITALILTLRVDKVRRIKSLVKSILKDMRFLSDSRIITSSDMGRHQIQANSLVVSDTEGLQSAPSMTSNQTARLSSEPSPAPSPSRSSGPSSELSCEPLCGPSSGSSGRSSFGPSSERSSGSMSVNSTSVSEQPMSCNQPRASHDRMEMLLRSSPVNSSSALVSYYQSIPRQQPSQSSGTGLETDDMSSDSDTSSIGRGRAHVRILNK